MSNIITVAKQQPTIVMVPAKAVKQDLKTETNTIVYMPLASRVTHGVVQIGEGLNIDADGVLTLDRNEITILQIAKNGEIIQPDENKLVNIELTKNDVGLNNVDNTADKFKPISMYQQEALDKKLNKYVGSEHAGKMVIVDGGGNIDYRQMLHQFVTKSNGKTISTDTLAYNYSDMFVITTTNGTEINIDGSAKLKDSFTNVTYDAASGVLQFTRFNGRTLSIDLPLELLIKGGHYDDETSELVLILANDNEIRIPLHGLIDTYLADDVTLQMTTVDGASVFKIKNRGVKTDHIADNSVTDEKIVTVSGSKVVGAVSEATRAVQDEHGENISMTYRTMADSYNKLEVNALVAPKAEKTQLPKIRRWGGF